MRPTCRLCLSFVYLVIGASTILGGRAAFANPGDPPIKQFLDELVFKHLAVELDQIGPALGPEEISAIPPAKEKCKAAHFADGCCGDEARTKLKSALTLVAKSPSPLFQPEYCIYQVSDEGKTRILWISFATQEVRYFASDGTFDQSGITSSIATSVNSVFNSSASVLISTLPTKCAGSPGVGVELLSVDPNHSKDLFGQQRWKRLGHVSLSPADRDRAFKAINDAIATSPAHTARAFTPRLALVSDCVELIQDEGSSHWVVLMSFDCRVVQLYADGHFRGCCAIDNSGQDQILNNILKAAGQPLKPKSSSSSD
jgi:hypothetical protein